MCHDGCPQSSEDDNPCRNVVEILWSLVVEVCVGMVVGELKEGGGASACGREPVVCEEEEDEEVEGQAWWSCVSLKCP